ncbi:hypothetical protein G1C95_1397 [Bifidobacterium sp. DSM 109957]|uniref:Uncharacterized protein n=2 Tax=Bifidobacterium oedipodis TaxID=2675322 RepID=A0A7Y0EPW2_9BIFI|nr:hypothetical protein [Bifidobacterium sp. DSM 109957]
MIRQWIRGALAALVSMAIYAIALGCYLALMLLVISMEEGGDNLTTHTNPLTFALVLLSEGSGFTTTAVTLTITPLLLTILLIWLIATVTTRLKAIDLPAYAAGLVVWLVINEGFRRSVEVGLTDDQWLVLCKAGAVFTLGFACAALPASKRLRGVVAKIASQISVSVKRCLILGTVVAAMLIGMILLAGLITVIVWCVNNHAAVVTIFEGSGMETGSRILTTVAMVAWLPNVMLWAVSWLFGAGFAIGDLADFTLWSGQATDLPSIPVFGILPEAVNDDIIRMVLMNLPLALALIVGLLMLFLPQGFGYRPQSILGERRGAALVNLAYPAASFCLAAGLVSLISTVLFTLSNGSLGQHRLANVGVNVMAATRAIGHPVAIGLAAAWLVALVGTALVFSIGWLAERIKASRAVPSPNAGIMTDASERPSDAQQPQTSKEESDDKHESTDTPSIGIRLP